MINLIGSILDSSGYSIHTRNLFTALSKIADVKLTSQIMPGQEILLTDKELIAMKKKGVAETNLIITHPLFWRMHSTAKRNIAYCVWEGDKVPKYFLKEMMNPEITYILVPSTHTKQSIINTIGDTTNIDIIHIEEKIKIAPHGVNLELFYPIPNMQVRPFRFIANKGFRNMEDRGGIQYLLQAYLEEFTDKDNVELLVKINPAYGIPDLGGMTQQFMNNKKTYAPINFLTLPYKYDQMVKFYAEGDIFVSPTRAEAFNLPCIEAMACGLPVITTNFGGQTDYVNENNGFLIAGTPVEVKHEVQYEGIKWVTPSTDDLRKTMRFAYEHPDIVKQKGQLSYEKAKEFTWDMTADIILKLTL